MAENLGFSRRLKVTCIVGLKRKIVREPGLDIV